MNRYDFINAYTSSGVDTYANRVYLLDCFDLVRENVTCAHCESDPYYMSDYILRNQNTDGSIIEFGCYSGGMSCKLSKVCELVGKKYIIFDTFSGLPYTEVYETYKEEDANLGNFQKGMFACDLENVKKNIDQYGSIKNCVFYEGLIEDTLKKLEENPLTIFIDVDLVDTARFVIKNMWDRVIGDRIFTHEACVKDYMERILDRQWWLDEMKRFPPFVNGNLFEKYPNLPNTMCLAYLNKYQSLG